MKKTIEAPGACLNDATYLPLDAHSLGHSILAINCGSSSVKLTLFDGQREIPRRILDMHLKASNAAQFALETHSFQGNTTTLLADSVSMAKGLQLVFDELRGQFGVDLSSIAVIGHRFVHGGSHYIESTILDKSVVHKLDELAELAPLHNAASIMGVKACLERLSIPQVAVFDTAFYSSMPAVAANYAIEHKLIQKYGIRRYGFHGISHESLWEAYKQNNPSTTGSAKIITLHLGSGCSATAIHDGNPIDTSMGFTPAEGLIMATRAGDIDAAIVEFLCTHEKMTPVAVMELLNTRSGLLGASGLSSDMQTLAKMYSTNEHARLAIDMFCYRVLKYIGAYTAALEGVEALVFSGGIGENSALVREHICRKMAWNGWEIHAEANQQAKGLFPGTVKKISGLKSTVALYVIAADENLIIAKEAKHAINGS